MKKEYTEEIRGFHTLWTAPYFTQNTSGTYNMQDYELLTMKEPLIIYTKTK